MSSAIGGSGDVGAFQARWTAQVREAHEKNDAAYLVYGLVTNILQAPDHKAPQLAALLRCKEDVKGFGTSVNKLKALTILDIFSHVITDDKPISLDKNILKFLPCDNKDQINSSLSIFRELITAKGEEGFVALASWISDNRLPLTSIGLTPEEFRLVAPHITYLYLSEIVPSTLHFEDFTSLDTVIFVKNSLTVLPLLPNHIKSLTCHEEHLKDVEKLPADLLVFDCSNCPSLKNIPPLPNSLKEFDCSFSGLIKLPSLNIGLEKFDCSGCHFEELPPLPDTLKQLDCRDCEELKSLPPLPASLKIDITGCTLLEGKI